MIENNSKIWLSSPHMSEEGYEMEYVREAFEGNWVAPLGPNVNAFEKEFTEMVGAVSAAALTSGTGAIHLALKFLDVQEGDIVLCSTLTFAATANPILYERATPVFIDSDEKTWNMDPKLLEEALQKYGMKVKAVLVVHIYGFSADMDSIMDVCNRYGVPVIEDAAESLGAYYKGQHTGTFGEFGVFSFNGNKIITTSGGGMLISNDEKKIQKVRYWATQSRDPVSYYQHSDVGYNYRMSNVLAGIGRGQLKVLERRVLQKKYIFDYYKKELGELPGVQFMPVNEWNSPNYWLSVMTIDGKVKPAMIIQALREHEIEARHVWKPMHMQPVFEGSEIFGGQVSEKFFEQGICLPSDTKMSDDNLQWICDIVKGCLK